LKNYRIIPVLLLLIVSNFSYGQNSPSLTLSIGLSLPAQDLGGELTNTGDSGISFISRDFIKNNYATSGGVSLSGTLLIPFEKNGLIIGRLSGSYTFFNVFRKTFFGVTKENNIETAVSFDNRFSATAMGIGIEINPFPESRIRPFVYTDFTVNLFSMSLIRNEILSSLFNDSFRLGLLPGAGITFKFNKEYSFVLGGSYHFGNLFLKSGSSSFDDRIVFEREGIPINDMEGLFYTNLSDPDSFPQQITGRSKSINWWNISLGINIVLGK